MNSNSLRPAATPTAPPRAPITALQADLGVILALTRRDLIRLVRDKGRWIGLVAQPLMLWAILGTGFSESLLVDGSAGGASRFLFPGLLGIVLLFTSIFSTMSIIEDRESGFLQGVLVAPGSPMAMVIGKTMGVSVIVLVQTALFLGAAPLAGISWGGISWHLLLLVVLLANTGLTCANFVFAWLLRSTQAYHALMSIVLMPLWVMSGAMFPVPSGWMGVLVRVNPMSYGISALRHALGASTGADAGLALCLGVLTLVCVLSLGAAAAVTRRR